MNVHELTLQNYSAASGCPSACQPTLYLGTAGSYGNEQINVVLGEGWQGLTVKAVFQPSDVPVVVPDGGGVISVPWEATQSVIAYPKGRISFQGYSSGRLVNTSDVFYTVGGSSAGSDNTPAPTPDEFQQFVDTVKKDADRAAQAAADAEAAVQKVTDAGTQAVTDIGNAKDSALEAIGQTEQAAINQIKQTGETQVGAVQSAGTTQISQINSAGSAQVQAVKDEGAAQTAALNDAADAHKNELESIASHPPQPNTATGKWQVWNAETGAYQDTDALYQGGYYTASVSDDGTLTWQGSQEGMPELPSVNIKGPKGDKGDPGLGVPSPAQADAGKVPMVNEDGTGYVLREVSAGGGDAGQPGTDGEDGGYYTPSVDSEGNLSWTASKADMPSVPGTNIQGPEGPPYTLTEEDKQTIVQTVLAALPDGDAVSYGTPEPGIVATDNRYYTAIAAAIREKLGTSTEYQPAQMAAAIESIGVMPGIPVTVTGNPVNITDSVEWPLQGLKVYGKSTQVTTTGAQLFHAFAEFTSMISNGLTITKISDSVFMLNGTVQDENASVQVASFTLTPGTYSIRVNGSSVEPFLRLRYFGSGNGDVTNYDKTIEVQVEQKFEFYIQAGVGYIANNYRFEIMLNAGSAVKPWEPYTDGQATPNPNYPQDIVSAGEGGSIVLTVSDGADQSQSLTISTPNGLPGIPVNSGGNYTDAIGQQRACDVKDYSIGKYTQMVGHIESYNGENITTPYMSTTGQLSTGAEVYYVLDEPVVTDMSADELAAYRALHTYDGATVVSTAEDVAGLEVRYVANAQKYIDDRLAAAESHIQEIAAAQLNAQTGG